MEFLENIAKKLNGKTWVKNDKIRIYLSDDRDISAYIEFDELPKADTGDKAYFGANLKVFCDTKNQPTTFKVNRAKQKKHYWANMIFARLELSDKFKPCDDWHDIIL